MIEITIIWKVFGNCEKDQNPHTSRHCIVDKSLFTVKKWTRIVLVEKDDVEEFTADEGDRFNLHDQVGGCELRPQLVPVDTKEKAEEKLVRG